MNNSPLTRIGNTKVHTDRNKWRERRALTVECQLDNGEGMMEVENYHLAGFFNGC